MLPGKLLHLPPPSSALPRLFRRLLSLTLFRIPPASTCSGGCTHQLVLARPTHTCNSCTTTTTLAAGVQYVST